MKTLGKAMVGAAAASAMAAASVSPAGAQDWRRDRDRGNGIGAGEVIAGALIIGGIAALASSNSRGRDHDRRWGSPRRAVEQCVYAAERSGRRYRADVTDIRDVRETRNGYEVRGRIAANVYNRTWRRGDSNYGRGWNGVYRGWNDNLRGYDSGTFVCRYERGRVANIRYNGIRL